MVQLPAAAASPPTPQAGALVMPFATGTGSVKSERMKSTDAICGSDRQLSPLSAPPGQRSVRTSKRQALTWEMTPSTAPSKPSQAAIWASPNSLILAGLSQPAPLFENASLASAMPRWITLL